MPTPDQGLVRRPYEVPWLRPVSAQICISLFSSTAPFSKKTPPLSALHSIDLVSFVPKCFEDLGEMVPPADFHGEDDLCTADGHVAVQSGMGHVEDVRLLRSEDSGDCMEAAGYIVDDHREHANAMGGYQAFQYDPVHEREVDVPAAHDQNDPFAAKAVRILQERCQRHGPGALDNELLPLQEQKNRTGYGILTHGEHGVHVSRHERKGPLTHPANGDTVGYGVPEPARRPCALRRKRRPRLLMRPEHR